MSTAATKLKPKQQKSQQLIAQFFIYNKDYNNKYNNQQSKIFNNQQQSKNLPNNQQQQNNYNQFNKTNIKNQTINALYKYKNQQYISIYYQQLIRTAQQQHITKLRQKKQQLQIDNGCLVYKLQKLTKDYGIYLFYRPIDEQIKSTRQQIENMKHLYDTDIKKHQQITTDYQQAINQRKQYLLMNQQLRQQLKFRQQQLLRIIADKDRDKLQTVDFMKKDMYEKAKQLKSTLLTMKRQQMSTNARLTILQNQQLLQQLQYQSKHTQKILKKNQLLEKELIQIKKQLQIEKQINDQLAKRTTIAKKIIKNINQKSNLTQHMEKDQQIDKKKNINNNNKDNNFIKGKEQSQTQTQTLKKTITDQQQLITILQNELIKQSKQLQTTKTQLQKYQHLYNDNQSKYQSYLKIQGDLRVIMIRFLKNMLQGKQIQKKKQQQVEYDITRLKDIDVDKWSTSDIQITIKMLLTFLKPYFTMKHMKAQYFRYTNKSSNNGNSNNLYIGNNKDKASQIDTNIMFRMPNINQRYVNYSLLRDGQLLLEQQQGKQQRIIKRNLHKGKSLSTFLLVRDNVNCNDKYVNNYKDNNNNNNINNKNIQQSIQQQKQQHAHSSTKTSPIKKQKQFSLHSILKDLKSLQKQKIISKKQKIKKSQSQHNLTTTIISTIGLNMNKINNNLNNNNNNLNNKFISGQEQIITNQKKIRKNHRQNSCQLIQFNLDNFKSKQSKKLVKSNYRQWGQKINLRPRGSFIGKKTIVE